MKKIYRYSNMGSKVKAKSSDKNIDIEIDIENNLFSKNKGCYEQKKKKKREEDNIPHIETQIGKKIPTCLSDISNKMAKSRLYNNFIHSNQISEGTFANKFSQYRGNRLDEFEDDESLEDDEIDEEPEAEGGEAEGGEGGEAEGGEEDGGSEGGEGINLEQQLQEIEQNRMQQINSFILARRFNREIELGLTIKQSEKLRKRFMTIYNKTPKDLRKLNENKDYIRWLNNQ